MRQKSSKFIKCVTFSGKSHLYVNGLIFPCQIGRTNFKGNKFEGDGATPRHPLPFREVFYRKDRVKRPITALKVSIIQNNDAWEERSNHPLYNHLTKNPPAKSEEYLMRQDNLYDIVIVLGWNDKPVKKNRGSAIFMHISRDKPTAGCITLSLDHLKKLLPRLSEKTIINPLPRKARYRP